MSPDDKMKLLKDNIKEKEKIAVAFSGGVDSTFLLKVAYDVLGQDAVAVTARSLSFPEREYREAAEFASSLGVRQVTVTTNELEIEGFAENPPERCYICKKAIFTKICEAARDMEISHVADGSNVDDSGDYRPGMKALAELGIESPLKEAGMTKDDIRLLSRELGLPTWDKPAYACLATRFPYGQEITGEKLVMVDRAEQYLAGLGFRQLRVRFHGDVARIEVPAEDRSRFFDEGLMDRVYEEFRNIGFRYTALDLKGYRTGSMNETLGRKVIEDNMTK